MNDPSSATAKYTLPIFIYARPEARAELGEELAGWLLDEMGAEVEETGGGCRAVVHHGPAGSRIMITGADGSDLPTLESWMVGAYLAEQEEALSVYVSHDEDGRPLGRSLRDAVSYGCAILSDYGCDALSGEPGITGGMEGCEYWLVVAIDRHGDLHSSEIAWGDGMEAADAVKMAFGDMPLAPGLTVFAHGPYICGAPVEA